MVSSTLLFESGVMQISDYDPIHGRYETRTLQLPSLPMFDQLDLSLFDSPHHENTISPSSTTLVPCTTPTHNMSRFIECFELQDPGTTTTTIKSSTSLRSRKSTSSKKTAKSPRRCYSNPTMSKKSRMLNVEPLDSIMVTGSTNAPKRSLSNAFHVLSGLLPKNKRRVESSVTIDDDQRSHISVSSTTTTIRQAWQSATYVDEIKTSVDYGVRRPLSSRYQTRSWWTSTPSDICVKS